MSDSERANKVKNKWIKEKMSERAIANERIDNKMSERAIANERIRVNEWMSDSEWTINQ